MPFFETEAYCGLKFHCFHDYHEKAAYLTPFASECDKPLLFFL